MEVNTRLSRRRMSDRARRVIYSSATLSVVAGAVAVLGAPFKWY